MDKEDLQRTYERIQPFIHRTAILTSVQINGIADARLYFKCENFQRMGAFKMRGATNAVLNLTKEQQKKGVVTHSSGNFAQALTLAATSIGIPAYIVMPTNAADVKRAAVKGYGGKIILCEPTLEARERAARQIVIEKEATFIHPSNDIDVILGQGTACIELLEEQPDLNFIITPVGGGGLVAGTSLAAHYFGNDCKVIGAEPLKVDDAFRSLISGQIETNESVDTIADGLKTNLGDINFPIIQKYVDKIILVTEDEIVSAMRLIYERMKIIVEPSAAVALAAILNDKKTFRNKKIGIILSGGNVDLSALPF